MPTSASEGQASGESVTLPQPLPATSPDPECAQSSHVHILPWCPQGWRKKLILLFILLLWAALTGMPGSLGECRGQASRIGQREGCEGCCASNVTPPQADANPVSSSLIVRALVFNNLPLNKLENKLSGSFPKQILSVESSEASLRQRVPQGATSPAPRELTPGEAGEGQLQLVVPSSVLRSWWQNPPYCVSIPKRSVSRGNRGHFTPLSLATVRPPGTVLQTSRPKGPGVLAEGSYLFQQF